MLRLPQASLSSSSSPPAPLPTNTKRPSSRGGGSRRGGGAVHFPPPRTAARWLVAAWVVAATLARRRASVVVPPPRPPQLLAVIGVLSPPGHFAQRALIRQTYALNPPEGIAVRFVVAEVDAAEADAANGNGGDPTIRRDAKLGPEDLWRQADGNLARALAREARAFGDLAWRLPTLRGVRDDRAHMARKTLGWFQAVGGGVWESGDDGGGGGGGASLSSPPSSSLSSLPMFVLKTDDDVVLHLPNLKRRLLRILEEGRLVSSDEDEEDGDGVVVEQGEEEEEGEGAEGRDAAQPKPKPKRRRKEQKVQQPQLGTDAWIYFGRPISSPIFPEGNRYMQGSLYGFSRALARAVADATPTVAQVEASSGNKLYDPAPLEGHEDYLASQWVLRAVEKEAGKAGRRGRVPPPPAPAPPTATKVWWANASSAEVHDTPLIASPFSLRLIAPHRVLAVHNAKHPLEFMHAYGGTVKDED